MRATKPGLTAVRTMTAVIYCRVSQDDERSGRSVDEQETECRERAEQEDWSVVRVFDDNDISASRHSNKSRPDHEALVTFLEDGGADVLILWATSRGDRNLTRWSTLLDLCRRQGIRIHVVRDRRTYDLNYSRDWETLASDGVKNAAYVEEIRDAVMRAMRDNAREGKPHGKTPYGYTREYATIRGRQVCVAQHINEAQAEIIREAAKRVAEGEALNAVCRDFNAREIPSPGNAKWDITKLGKVLTNPAYIGKRIYIPKEDRKRGIKTSTLTDAEWSPILDESTWQTCVDKLSDPTRKTHRDTAIKHLLSHIVTCGVCHSLMKAHTNNGYPVYMCKESYCTSIPRKALDDYVEAEVKKRLVVVKLVDDEDQDTKRQATKDEITELQDQLDEAREQYLRPASGTKRLSAVMLAQIESDLEPQIHALQAEMRASRVLPIVGKLISNPEKWDDMSLPEKREFLRSGSILDGIDVLPNGKGWRKTTEERTEIHWVETRLSRNPNN